MSLTDSYPFPEWRSYAATLIDVTLSSGATLELRVDEWANPAQWPFVGTDEAWIVTACNPRSVPLSDSENLARHQAMLAEFEQQGTSVLAAEGRDPISSWREPGYLLPGDQGRAALEAAKRWEQNAVFHWTIDGLAIIGVLQPGYMRFGWTFTPGDD